MNKKAIYSSVKVYVLLTGSVKSRVATKSFVLFAYRRTSVESE